MNNAAIEYRSFLSYLQAAAHLSHTGVQPLSMSSLYISIKLRATGVAGMASKMQGILELAGCRPAGGFGSQYARMLVDGLRLTPQRQKLPLLM